MPLAMFDIDNTVLEGDSEQLWANYMVEQGVTDDIFQRRSDQYMKEYDAGILNIYEYQEFMLEPLARTPMATLIALRRQFMDKKIQPVIRELMRQRVQWHQRKGDRVIFISATNAFVTSPIADVFQVEDLISTIPEIKNGEFTGKIIGIPSFQEGKIKRMRQWLEKTHYSFEESWFYSDSHNDIPLLEEVTYPVAVTPDPQLAKHARQRAWLSIFL